jgi:pimeloyl-ACP methyl ester carboxylesterase
MMGSVTSTMPAAVFLHSGPALSHEYLLPHMKRLLPGRLLVFYDMRASGRTSFGTGSSSSTITAAQHAADVDDLLDWVDHHKDTTKVDLIGHGYGAAIAALYAAAHPERVSRLLLTTPYPANIDMLVESQIQFNRRLSSGDRRMLSAIMNRSECLRDISLCFLQLWAILGPKAMCSEHQDKFGDLNFLYGEFRAERFVTNQLQESRYDWEPTLRTIQTPTWIFQATRTSTDCDTVPPESTDIYADSIPGARRFVLHRSGHFPMVEAPDEYFALLKSALIYP